MSEIEYKPADGVYLFRNAATKTMMDLINGGNKTPRNPVQAYEKVESEDFRNQYWSVVNIGNPDMPNAYNFINIRTGWYLTIFDDDTDVTATGKYHDDDERSKTQQWLFWEGKSRLCRIQNVARREINVAKGYMKLGKKENFVPIKVDLKDDDLTQQWRLINRTRTKQEVTKLAEEDSPLVLGNTTALTPPLLYLQIPNIMYQIIQAKYTSKGQIIQQGKARFDKTQVFAFKDCVDKWANDNLHSFGYHVLVGLAFGELKGAAKTAVWGLRDDDLDSIAYFDMQKGQIQNADPKFTPSNTFF